MTALRPEREDLYGDASYESYGGDPYGGETFGGAAHAEEPYAEKPYAEKPYAEETYAQESPGGASRGRASRGGASAPYVPPADDETVALRIPDPPPPSISASTASSVTSATGSPQGGRAARRKAAKGRHGRHGGGAAPDAQSEQESPDGRPLSRVEARRQAKARKPGAAVLASRAIGEVFITTGVLMLLFVSYQLWWTNVRAHAAADREASSLQNDWASGKGAPGTFEPGQGFALLHIPKLDVVVPIAEGVSNKKVLDKGMVGHYGEGALKTAMPDAKTGNFALAGHRNTHGEPFRYINKLSPGDAIVVETQDEYFVYKMTSTLPVTSPSNTSVIDPVPKGSGFTTAGRYITLTTCTPEFTSKYRLIVWGKMVEERPRSKGKPDALVQ
ncbi:class E sortase [Streptomyces pseudovenezuelae]|uniref:class E sortase n=1 Tax=Streptomyces pseudovenezuelae TaxID=67350 RepID=UPI002E808A35|nr:class E sortase [Streptomyces pseudovenezuelae]WUA89814.1 class E sortase [Streptomyces pseudovenezuelae]